MLKNLGKSTALSTLGADRTSMRMNSISFLRNMADWVKMFGSKVFAKKVDKIVGNSGQWKYFRMGHGSSNQLRTYTSQS